jgi:hypothetical protein
MRRLHRLYPLHTPPRITKHQTTSRGEIRDSPVQLGGYERYFNGKFIPWITPSRASLLWCSINDG